MAASLQSGLAVGELRETTYRHLRKRRGMHDRDDTAVRRHLTRDVNRIGRVPAGQRVGEPDHGCLGPVEDLGKDRLEIRVGRIIGP